MNISSSFCSVFTIVLHLCFRSVKFLLLLVLRLISWENWFYSYIPQQIHLLGKILSKKYSKNQIWKLNFSYFKVFFSEQPLTSILTVIPGINVDLFFPNPIEYVAFSKHVDVIFEGSLSCPLTRRIMNCKFIHTPFLISNHWIVCSEAYIWKLIFFLIAAF